MFIKLLDGPHSGQTRDIANAAAQGLLAQGRAIRAFQEEARPVTGNREQGEGSASSVSQPAPHGDNNPVLTLEQTEGKKKKTAR
jgi:hypothetical protein